MLTLSNDDQTVIYPPEFLNSINISGIPSHELNLEIGTPIMQLKNLNYRNGHCNGTRCKIVTANNHLLTARKLTGIDVGDIVLIPRVTLMPSDSDLPFTLQRRQLPIRPAFDRVCQNVEFIYHIQCFLTANYMLPLAESETRTI